MRIDQIDDLKKRCEALRNEGGHDKSIVMIHLSDLEKLLEVAKAVRDHQCPYHGTDEDDPLKEALRELEGEE